MFQVDGVWDSWGEWEPCSVTCGGVNQTRERQCIWSDETQKGQHCDVDGSDGIESRKCGDVDCPCKLNLSYDKCLIYIYI